MICAICDGPASRFASAPMLEKYEVEYFRCDRCGFVRTEEPYWLEEAYGAAITSSDVGLIRRNMRLASVARLMIAAFFDGSGRFVDYAGGYGLFVRLMRDSGYDFRWYDKHCMNLFAKGFEAKTTGHGEYGLLTAFEVFEHLVNPIEEIREMLSYSRNIFFTTELSAAAAQHPANAPYYGLEHGQHVSFYTRRSLELIAERFSLNLYSDGTFRHLLTEKRISPLLFNVLSKYKVAALLSPFTRRESLTPADYRDASGSELL